MNITRGRKPGAKKVVIYGPEGIGKSTFASRFPDALFSDTEDSTKDMDVSRFDKPSSWEMLKSQVRYVIDHPEVCKTYVLDTADWAEQIEIRDLLSASQKAGIEDFGYGKGYTYSAERFGELLNLMTELTEKGINVVVTAHAQLRKIELPEEMGAYDHWEMKTSKKVAPMIREWADLVLFANYKVNVVNVDNQGATKGKNKAQGGRRVMYTTHTPFWDAKNRYGLPEELPLDYEQIRHVIEDVTAKQPEPIFTVPDPVPESQKTPAATHKKPEPAPEEILSSKSDEKPAEKKEEPQKLPGMPEPIDPPSTVTDQDLDKRIPKNLRDLMLADNIGDWDIMNICESKGYVPTGTNIWDYETVNPGLIDGGIIGNWPSVVEQIRQMRKNAEIPFN